MARRRGHGEGSIYQRESDGLWVGSADLGMGPDGKRRRRNVTARTQAQCLEKFRALQQGLENKEARGSKQTFASWSREWLEDYKHHVKVRSYELAKLELERHINPRIGDTPLRELSVTQVRRLQNEITALVSARTGLHCRNRVKMVLDAARNEGLLAANVADAVRRVKEEAREMTIWSAAEVKRFIEVNRGQRDFPLFNFYLSTGARRSEALALRWDDIHFEQGYLRINKTITWEQHRPKISSVTKTAAGMRDIPINARIRGWLAEQREALERERASHWHELGLVFPNRRGGIDENIDRSWALYKEAAKVSDIRIHDLRHTFVSMCIERGMNVVRLSRLIGHADPSFTLRVYAHLFERAERFELPDLEDELLS